MKPVLLLAAFQFAASSGFAGGQQVVPPGSGQPEPIYFHISHHQEDVGHPSRGFPAYERFKKNLREELHLLDSFNVVSDQCFSDFMVSVILHMKDTGKDPGAMQIFDWFNNSRQNLGYHFHPSTWDINIRLEKIRDMGLEEGIREYEKWESAYYDWSEYLKPADTMRSVGFLDTARLGGIQLMLNYFKKPLVNENLTLINPAAGQVIRQKFGQVTPVVGQTGNPHSYYTTNSSKNLWISDWGLSPEPWVYAYKLMGNYYVQNRSEAWVEGLFSVPLLKQVLGSLRRDIPHFFAIHLSTPPEGDQSLKELLTYLTREFIPANPGSQFISTAAIPEVTLPNPREFTMPELEEACRTVLFNWHGRPPAFAACGGNRYLSLASLFKALQETLCFFLGPGSQLHQWPLSVTVPAFIRPPDGPESSLIVDRRLIEGLESHLFNTAILQLDKEDIIPLLVSIPSELPGKNPYIANAGDMLKGMCTYFLQLRSGIAPLKVYILPSGVIPITDLAGQYAREHDTIPGNNMDWLSGLQLWTLEPLQLKNRSQLSGSNGFNVTPSSFELGQNFPNPFRTSTSIRFYTPGENLVDISVYDMTGRRVSILTHRRYGPGWHEVLWDGAASQGCRCRPGLYLYQMRAGSYLSGKKTVRLE